MTASQSTQKVRLRVSPQVAKIVGPGAPRDAQLAAARGALPLSGKDLLTALFLLCNSNEAAIKRAALQTLKDLPESTLRGVARDPDLHPQLINLLARVRLDCAELIGDLIMHPATSLSTLQFLAGQGDAGILERLVSHQRRMEQHPELVPAILANPNADRALKFKLGWQDPEEDGAGAEGDESSPGEEEFDEEDEDVSALMEEAEEEDASKYQIAMDLKVSEKIKIGMSGDKEWRTILIKDANKLVQSAVMKNPRISDNEVIMVAKNKTSSDELIRLILLNKEWMKLYEIKKALATHPKTPLPKAIRLVAMLNTKDIKDLIRSKNVSTIISTTARKEFERRQKRGGG